MTAGVRTGKAQNEHMFYWFAPESGPREVTATRPLSAQHQTIGVMAGQCAVASALRRISEMISAMSSAILGPCVRISENSASEIRSRNPVLKLGHSRAKAHQAATHGRFFIQRSRSPR